MTIGTVFVNERLGDIPYLKIEKLAIDMDGIDGVFSKNTLELNPKNPNIIHENIQN